MVAINPQLRISPSGAEAIGSTNPFSDYSGFAFTALNSTQNDSEVLAPIGPQGSSTDAFITFEAGTALSAPQARREVLEPLTAKAQGFELGAGDWLFDLQVAHGFGSVTNSGPSVASFFGAISVAVSIVDDSGASVGTVTGTAQPVNPPQRPTDTGAADQVKAARWTVVISIPEATIAANANKPVKGISIVLRRVNSDNPLIGQYNSDSGDLNVIAQSTNLILRKVS